MKFLESQPKGHVRSRKGLCLASLHICVLISTVLLSSGCATIVSKSRYPVSIITEPPAASIEVKDQDGVVQFIGTSPATAMLDAGSGYFTRARYTVTASKDGFTSASMPLQSSINGWYWGNIFVGGLIGLLLVDPISGAMFQIDNPQASMSLAPAVTPVSLESDRLRKLKELHDTGILTDGEYRTKRKALVQEL